MRAYLRQLASESLIYGVAGIVQRFVAVFLVPVYTRVFTPAEYGLVSVVTAAMAAVTIFVVLALDAAAHRWFWDTEDDAERKATIASWAWCQLAASIVAAVALVVFAPWIARELLDDAAAAPLLRVAAWSLPLGTFPVVLTNWLRMRRRPWATAAYALCFLLLTLAASVALVVGLGRGVRGVFEAQVVVSAATGLVSIALLRDWVSPAHVRWTRLVAMLRYAFPLIPAAVALWVVGMLDRLWVQHYADAAEVGLYQVGAMVAAGVALGTNAFQQAWGPFSLSIHKRDDARSFYAVALLAYLWAATLLAAAVSLFAPEIVRVFATPAYLGAMTVVAPLAFSFVLMGSTYVAAVGPGIARQTSPMGIAVVIAAGVNVAFNLAVTPRLGREGAALANLVSQAVMAGFLFWRAQQIYPIPYRFGAAVGLLVFGGAVAAAGMAWRPASPWVAGAGKIALLALWIPALLVFRIATPSQLGRLLRRRAPVETPAPSADAETAGRLPSDTPKIARKSGSS